MDELAAETPPVTGAAGTPIKRGPTHGLPYGIAAYTLWGFVPLYFHALAHVSPWRVLCHRVFWSALFLSFVISIRGEWRLSAAILRNGRAMRLLLLSALLIAMNWLVFIYAVGNGQVLQASLGYFITPLLSIALGMLFLRERLNFIQWCAVILAIVAVANLGLTGGGLPWVAIGLALSFGFYGLVRKKVDLNSLHGLLIETCVLLPLALLFFGVARSHGPSFDRLTFLLLALSGLITAVPLLLFGVAVRHLPLKTIGFLQYIGPTFQFIIGLWIYREPLARARLFSFSLCWLGIALYVADSLRRPRPAMLIEEPD